MAFEYPDNLQYTDTHEYLKIDGDIVTIGITEFAIDQLGDVVFLELPDLGDNVEVGEKFGTIESVKAVEDLKSPVNGEVLERNDQLLDAPEQIGDDPYGDGWLIRVKADDLDDIDDDTMTAEEYTEQVEGL
ncbi:glycine cleavage system protein GcvH [Leptolyngbyaceae cyanobacterium CCMR0082]|uniref:Glycine cleavage system H protein n=2 Tax=Adonisia turfae TaxID=2950184 RepID=A0A6M0SBR4_9CYAN|nr:glycine cleavage system protein GcvH [Adonisia turfae]EKV00930.1 glycine cleavage system H protein [Leptolyngbya sp. PCC 7375]MDV3352760.1 glycine cleavage system protein GcvH [Leptothoe sp. LEGE 181152]NEZ56258.1 glycine cleavage system protein GcvH [Adonisia turfae CCMR0081]NEZ65910.1 glycine cleavage system protein GcvH [Adonisia turfae CCMR0082]